MSTNHAAAKLRSVPKRARPGLHHPPKPAPNARGHAVTALSISRALVSKAGRVRRRNTTGLNPLAFIPAPGRLARPGAFKTYHLPQLRQLAAFARQGEAHWKHHAILACSRDQLPQFWQLRGESSVKEQADLLGWN
jgi:hypothetical protein